MRRGVCMDELPPEARALLDAVSRADDPSPAARARADARVREALAREGVHGLPPLAPPRSTISLATRLSSGMRSALTLTIGASAVIAAVVIGVRSSPRDTTSNAPAPAQPTPPVQPHAPAPVETPANVESRPLPAPGPRHASDSTDAHPNKHARAAPAPERAKPATANAGDDTALERELKALASADQLVRAARFTDALALLDRSDPGDAPYALREERTALRVLCMCGRGVDERALRERDRFLTASPHSVLASRVRTQCTPRSEIEP